MKTVALQAPPDLAHFKKHQPPVVRTAAALPWSMQPPGTSVGSVVQRKCACGGGCPSCEAEADEQKPQTKLSISSPGDVFEREADAVADQVMRMPDDPLISRKTNGGAEGSTVSSSFTNRLGPGAPLDSASRNYFEPRFGRDFSAVRVHTDEAAASSAAAIHARAYTIGRDVVFAAGQFSPGTSDGQHLLAHELAHVAQQEHGAPATIRREPADGDNLAPTEQPVPLDEPNKAPSCDDVCGNTTDKCTQEPGEQCSDDMSKKVMAAWTAAATQLSSAIDAMNESPLSATTLASLKANFNWSPGGSPKDLTTTVSTNLSTAATKMSDNLCLKCATECQKGGVAQIARARGVNCLGSNCFRICPNFTAADTHVLLHELFHRVVSSVDDLYRNQPGYPPPPSMALKMADCYASLIDDTSAAAAAAAKAKAKAGKTTP
jgi:Domain of unknown function (DUF4157)